MPGNSRSLALLLGLLLLGLAAVIESGNGDLSYWALKHPPGKPDFHHAHGFVYEVDVAQ